VYVKAFLASLAAWRLRPTSSRSDVTESSASPNT
jgi:hypothetical protein